MNLKTQKSGNNAKSSWHLFVLLLEENVLGLGSRRKIYNRLRDAGIGVNVHYEPVHLQPYYQRMGFSENMFPNAEKYGKECISIPIFPDLREEMLDYICEEVIANVRIK